MSKITPENFLNDTLGLKNVSRETFLKLEEFANLLLKWNSKINLVSKSSANLEEIWQRHIYDSAQLVKYIPSTAKTITDFGSGAGFPSIILAIIGDWQVHLIESDQRKCAFLNEAKRQLNLNIHVHNERIENIQSWESDVLTARALASLDKLFNLTETFHRKDKICLFLKGQNVVQEIEEASKYWVFDYQTYPSLTSDTGCIIEVTNLTK